MLRRVQQYINQHELLRKEQPVLVAVSGGADSVALLHILLQLGYTCHVAHCNFHLRGEESDRDERFVRDICAAWELPLHVQDFATTDYATQHGLSIEMAARELRYTWFEQLRHELACQAIAVAHHQNDQAETVLLNLLRGSGLRGLEGMHPKNDKIVRPLLTISREAILDYLTIEHLSYVTDSTNLDTTIQRNAIRAQLSHYQPAQIAHIAQTSHLMQGYEQIVNAYVDSIRAQVVEKSGAIVRINMKELQKHSSCSVLLYELLREYGFTQTSQIYESMQGESGKRFYSSNWQAVIDRDYLLIAPLKQAEETVPTIAIELRNKQLQEHFFAANALTALFDGKIAQAQLTIRHWKEGDWFVPLGMKGKKKLQDFFTDQKLSVLEKDQVWLLCADEQIAWVIGYRIDERFSVKNNSLQVAQISIQ